MKHQSGFGTRAAAGWRKPDAATTPVNAPVYYSNTYVYDTLDAFMEAGSREMLGRGGCYFYTRTGNPTNAAFEDKIADLECAERAVSFASGMGAISAALFGLLKSGDRVVAHDKMYSATDTLFGQYLPTFGIDVETVDLTDIAAVKRALSRPAAMLFIETPANPLVEVVDIPEVAKLARAAGALTVVDSTWASPYLMRALSLGADLVAASSTKYLNGHDEAMGGYVAGGAGLVSRVANFALVSGGCMAPVNAAATLRGMRTLHVRMDRHCDAAMQVAKFLEGHPRVKKVHYPGLKSHPQHDAARKTMDNYSGMIAFWIKGGAAEAVKLLNSVKVCNVAVSLGDACTLIEHPATMTHITVERERRERLGITDNLIRLSVGLEDVRDLVRDLDRALSMSR